MRPLHLVPLVLLVPPAFAQQCMFRATAPVPSQGAELGSAVALDDVHAIAGQSNVQEVLVWRRQSNQWDYLQTLHPHGSASSDVPSFGGSVDVEGDLIVVGCNDSDEAHVFERNASTGLFEFREVLLPNDLVPGDQFGQDVTIEDRTIFVASMRADSAGLDAGAVYVFEESGPVYAQTNKLIAPDAAAQDFFGVAIDTHDDVLVVGSIFDDDGAFNAGSAYVYRRNAMGLWGFETKIPNPDPADRDFFGVSVATNVDSGVIIGCEGDDDNGEFSGSAYVFLDSTAGWYQATKLVAPDGGINHDFGFSVACSGGYYDVGARGADGATGAVYRYYVAGAALTLFLDKLVPTNAVPGTTFGAAIDMNSGPFSGIFGAPGHSEPGAAVAGAVYFSSYLTGAFQDCNANFVDDHCELIRGDARDGNENGLLDECEDVGTVYCSPNTLNSSGTWGKILAQGSTLAADNDLILTAFDLPANAFGIFFTGKQLGFVAFPANSQGIICLVGTVGRFATVLNSGAIRRFTLSIDLTNIPISSSPAVQAGETWYFQCWHRDANPGLTSNFTEAVAISFQ